MAIAVDACNVKVDIVTATTATTTGGRLTSTQSASKNSISYFQVICIVGLVRFLLRRISNCVS